jgi:drug/metabolite transporter (DMT)-like permease
VGAVTAPPPTSALKRGGAVVLTALLTQQLIAVGTYLIGKEVTSHVDPLTVVWARSTGSAVVLLAVIALLGPPYLPPRALWPKLALFGLLAGPINQGLFIYGLSKTTAAHASLLYALSPAGVYLGSLVLGRERFAARRIGGIVVALAGVTVLLLEKGLANAKGSLIGDAWVSMGVVSWVIVTLEGAKLSSAMGPLKTTSWMLVLSGVWVALASPWLVDFGALRSASSTVLGGIVYLIVFASAGAYILWYFVLSRMEASAAAVYSNLQPVGTALGAAAFLHEPLTVAMAVGGALVLIGVRVASRASP